MIIIHRAHMYDSIITGKWYLKKGIFGYTIMVQVAIMGEENFVYRKATDDEIAELGITCV